MRETDEMHPNLDEKVVTDERLQQAVQWCEKSKVTSVADIIKYAAAGAPLAYPSMERHLL